MIDFGHGVTLDALKRADLETLRNWRNDPRIWRWCRQNDLISDVQQEQWFDRIQVDPTIRMYGIYAGSLVGACGLTSLDLLNRRAEFSLYICPEQQGKGLSKPALCTLFEHGFMDFGLNSIWGETFDGNPAASIFESLGMKKEGTRREFYFRNGRFIDCHLYSVLRSEWACGIQAGAISNASGDAGTAA